MNVKLGFKIVVEVELCQLQNWEKLKKFAELGV